MKKSATFVICVLLASVFGGSVARASVADIRVHLGAGTIVIDRQELALTSEEIILVQEDIVYLPLRPVMEKLNYQVDWESALQKVSMKQGDKTYFLTVGSAQYVRNDQSITLDKVPLLINGRVIVPATFFTNVMNKTLDISNGHI